MAYLGVFRLKLKKKTIAMLEISSPEIAKV